MSLTFNFENYEFNESEKAALERLKKVQKLVAKLEVESKNPKRKETFETDAYRQITDAIGFNDMNLNVACHPLFKMVLDDAIATMNL